VSTAENKAVYRRFIEEGFNQGKLDTLDELLAPTYRDYDAPPGTPPGPAGIKQIVTLFRIAFPDLQITVDEQAAEGDLVTSRLTMRGTQHGELFGVPPTGKAVAMGGLTMIRMADGKLIEGWVKNDTFGLLQQLGALPAPSAAPV
jgi:predicted ester cyclase